MILRFVVTLLFSLICQSTVLAETIGIHAGSKHSKSGFNDFNPGAYLIFDKSTDSGTGLTIGGYRNSYRKSSIYAGYTKKINLASGVNLSIQGGIISGYKSIYGYHLMPMIAPSMTFEVTDDISARIFYIPKMTKNGVHVVSFAVESHF